MRYRRLDNCGNSCVLCHTIILKLSVSSLWLTYSLSLCISSICFHICCLACLCCCIVLFVLISVSSRDARPSVDTRYGTVLGGCGKWSSI